MERKDDADYVKACTRLVVEGKALVGRPSKTWQNTLSADMRLLKVDPQDVMTERNGGPLDGEGEPSMVWHTTLKRRSKTESRHNFKT